MSDTTRPNDIAEWMNHMDLHLTEHDLPHAGRALRAAWPAVRQYIGRLEGRVESVSESLSDLVVDVENGYGDPHTLRHANQAEGRQEDD